MPGWAFLVGSLLGVVFVGLSVDAYFGAAISERVGRLLADREAGADRTTQVAFYAPGDSARVGEPGTGSRAQARTLHLGDVVLLGGSRQLVRLEPNGRTSPIEPDPNAIVRVVNLGVWDPALGRVVGVSATRADDGWSVDGASLPAVGPDLFAPGASEEELGPEFWMNPSEEAGRVRRGTEAGGPVVRLRANRSGPYLGIESAGPLPTLDDAVVTVRALVRAKSSGTVGLTIFDVVDASGTADTSQDGRSVLEDGWTELTVRRRIRLARPEDKLSIGLYAPRSGDWIEVRALRIYLGAVP